MDDKPFEEDEKNALAGLIDVSAPTRKTHSYSQQLRSNTGTNINKRRNQIRNHSLDDISSNKNLIISVSSSNSYGYYIDNSSDDEEGFYPYSTNSATQSGSGAGTINNLPIQPFHDGLGGGHEDFRSLSQQQQQQSMPEFIGTGGGIGVFKVPSRAAVHPSRPPCLELRPHPLRETQVSYLQIN